MTEKELQQAVIECATALGWEHYHTRDSRGSDPGFPDLVLVRVRPQPPRLIFAELKGERGRLSIAQAHWLDKLMQVELGIDFALKRRGPVRVVVWRPEQWLSGEIEEALR